MPVPDDHNQIQELKQMIRDALTKIDQIKDEMPRVYLTRIDFEGRQEALEESTRKISDKLDKLTDELPNRFLDRLQYTTGHAEITKRVETNELRVEDLRKEVSVEKQRVNELYANGMAWANQTFGEIKDLLIQKSEATDAKLNQIQIAELQRKDDQRHQLGAQIRIVLISVGAGAVLSFVGTLILHAMHVL